MSYHTDIIPYKPRLRQVNFLDSGDPSRSNYQLRPFHFAPATSRQKTALELYNMGLNVFPQPYGKKGGYPWKQLQYTRLNRAHNQYGIESLFSGNCNIAIMCGKTSDNFFVIDCETLRSFNAHIRQMDKAQIPVCAVKTARGGHIYLRAKEGEVANIKAERLGEFEIRGANGYVLTVMSLHPSGALYEWARRDSDTIPVISIKQLNWLKDLDGIPLELTINNPKSKKKDQTTDHRLARETRDYLQHGHSLPEGSRNNRLFKAACDLLGNGYSYMEIEQLLFPVALASQLPPAEIRLTLNSANSKGRKPSRPLTKKYVDDTTHHFARSFAEDYKWLGRSRMSQRKIFFALVKRCELSCNENQVFRASLREISEIARVSLSTTQRILPQLASAGLIEPSGSDRMSTASLWKFTDRVLKQGKVLYAKMSTLSNFQWGDMLNVSISEWGDVIERGVLGHVGYRIYKSLCEAKKAVAPAQLAELSDCERHQVYYWLKRLQAFSLAHPAPERGKWLAEVLTLPELYERVSSAVVTSASDRRERHSRERALYIGRILFNRRLYCEGEAFMLAYRTFRSAIQCLGDYTLTLCSLPQSIKQYSPRKRAYFAWLLSLGVFIHAVEGRTEVSLSAAPASPPFLE
ncbi:hypothetical protein MASR2M15_16150 [Anaerolineales bacterium]